MDATVFENNRNISLLVREKVYRALEAFVGTPLLDDYYHDTSGSGFGLTKRECSPLRDVPDGLRASGCVFPDNIRYVGNFEHSHTGGERAFDVTFDVLIFPASKIRDSERVKYIEQVGGFLNTYFQEWPKFEGIFGMIYLEDFDPEFTKYETTCGKLTWSALLRRTYTVHTEMRTE